MTITALAHLAACIVIAMLGGYAAAGMWEAPFWPASAGSLFLLSLAQSIRS